MKNIKNILGMGAFMLLSSWAVSSCTEKSDWDIDPSYSRPFGTDENGISVETDDRVARAVVSWSSTQNTDYYLIEVSPNEMTEDTPMGSEENESLVFGNDPANRITRSPFTMEGLAVNTTYYLRIKSISGEKESRWVNAKKTFESVKEETILNIPSVEDLPEGEGKVRMTWEAGLEVDHFEIVETGAIEATTQNISAAEAAAGEAWIENLKTFTEYTITVYNGNTPRGSQTVTIPGLEIESTITDITDNSAVFAWETTVDVNEYACVPSTEGVPESGTRLSAEEIDAHKVTITGLNSSTEYTAYAFANGSICSRITFTTKKGKPVGYTEMTWDEANTNWESMSGNVLITLTDGQEVTLDQSVIPASVTNLVFWGDGKQSTMTTRYLRAAGELMKLEFYNIKLTSGTNDDPLIYQHEEANGAIHNISLASCTIENYRGVVRLRTTLIIPVTIEIDDCIIDKLGINTSSNNYGILQTSEFGSPVTSIELNISNTTFARPQGTNSIVMRTRSNQTNVNINISNCTFFGLRSGDAVTRDITAASTNLKLTNTLFAGTEGCNLFNGGKAPVDVSGWRFVYTSSDFVFKNFGSASYSPLPLTTSSLFPNAKSDVNTVLDLTYGDEVSNEYKAIGDPRWNK